MNVASNVQGAVTIPVSRQLGSGKPPAATEISYNSQDSVVLQPGSTKLSDVGPGPSVPRAELSGKPLEPVNGGYVYEAKDPKIHAALPFASVAQTIAVFEAALGTPIQWAFNGEKLGVVADGGDMLNAYYAREEGTVNFFHTTDPRTRQKMWSGDSGEVVSHEAGHAILDGLRPGYFSAWSPDAGAFHEAFGDVVATVMSMRDERVLDKLVEQTGGDLSKPNLVAAMGEQIGIVINHMGGDTGGDYTRNSINTFKWADPATLPEDGGPDQLGSEVHSFSRLWTGASYDLLKGVVDASMQAGMAPKEALRAGGDELLKIYANLFKTAPKGDFTFREMAQAMVKADQNHNGGKNVDLIKKVFTERNILGGVGFQSSARRAFVEPGNDEAPEGTKNIRVALNGGDYGMFNGAVVETAIDQDGSLTKSGEVGARVQDSLKKLIAAGRIKYTEPNQALKQQDLFDSKGQPYVGVVRWQDGRMTIERVKIAS